MNAIFPTDTINETLYSGKRPIQELTFINCSFRHIAESVFNSNTFSQLKSFKLTNMTLETVARDLFYHTSVIESITFDAVQFDDLLGVVLCHTSSHLVVLHVNLLPNHLGLNNMVDCSRHWWNLEQLIIRSHSPNFRLLASENFTTLRWIEHIDFSHCGIEVIENGAFDASMRTLKTLNLSNNKLKSVDSTIIYKMLDRSERSQWNSVIKFENNPLQWNCDLFEMEAILVAETRNQSSLVCRNGTENECELPANCTELQVIHLSALCKVNKQNRSQRFLYPYFAIKYNPNLNNISIITNKLRRFRLLVRNHLDFNEFNSKWGYSDSKCPKNGYIQSNIKCFLLNGTNAALNLHDFNKHMKYLQICVNYVSFGTKHMWPLHCVTYHLLIPKQLSMSMNIVDIVIVIGSSVSGVCLATILLKAFFTLYNNNDRKKSADDNESGNNNADNDQVLMDTSSADYPIYESIHFHDYLELIECVENQPI